MIGKIFFGFVDIAGQLGDFAEAYSKKGYDVFTAVVQPDGHYIKRKYSIVLNNIYPRIFSSGKFVLLRKCYTLFCFTPFYHVFMLWAVLRFDIFHFFWYLDKSNRFYLYLIKKMGKKIIVSFVGSDVRWIPLWINEFDLRKLDHVDEGIAINSTITQNIQLDSIIRIVRVFEKYASIIISHPEQAQLQLRPYYNFYLPLNLMNLQTVEKQNKIPVVSLGIRDINLKGGRKVINLIKDYQKKEKSMKFNLFILENESHDKVIEVLLKTDIFIYSPYIGSAGKFSHEAIACGAVALVSYKKDWFKYPPDAPFVHIQENTLIERLDFYLRNKKEREELSRKGIQWARKWTDINWITSDILQKLEGNVEPDYYPEYFREHATFSTKWDAPDSVAIANKWTKYVSKCRWYKEDVKPGTRDGLIF